MSDEITMKNRELYIIYYQSVNYNDNIMIRTNECSPNQIIIKYTSIYIININCQFDEPCTIGFYINDEEYATYETGIFNNIIIHQLLKLNVNDLISIKYLSNYPNKIIGPIKSLHLYTLECDTFQGLDNEINLWRFDSI